MHICISRTDSIGDVVLTLPLAGYLKQKFPSAKVSFLCKSYTKPVVECCDDVDQVLLSDELSSKREEDIVDTLKQLKISHFIHVFPNKQWSSWAKRASIPHRIGTSHRLFHWLTCNSKINFTRKHSGLHESQLNFYLLKNLGCKDIPSLEAVFDFLSFSVPDQTLELDFPRDQSKKQIVLHPLSQGSALEWGIDNFMELSQKLTNQNCEVYFSGTEKEGKAFRDQIPHHQNIHDMTGKFSLTELMVFIQSSDVMVAASTGPLHLAGILNKKTIGLFSPLRPIHPGRWRPLGNHVTTLTGKMECSQCKKPVDCTCMSSIQVETVIQSIMK